MPDGSPRSTQTSVRPVDSAVRRTMKRYSVEAIESEAGFRRLEPEWRELESRLPCIPFVTFDWADAWWKHLRADSLAVRDELFLHAVRDEQGALRAVAPMMRTLRPGVGPFRSQQLHTFGADPNITEIRSMVVPDDEPAEVASALFEHLRGARASWDWFQLPGVSSERQLAAVTEQFGSPRGVREFPNYYLTLAPSWDEFKKGLSRNIKESLRKCYNAPKRDGVAFDFDVVREERDVVGALDSFFQLHELRANVQDTVPHPNVFSSPASRAFLVDVCRRFAARGALRIYQQKIRNSVVATRIGFVCGESVYLYFSGYEPEFGKYSVMTRTLAEAIQLAISEGSQTVNLSTGKDVSKLRWSPKERTYRDVLVVAPSTRSELSYHAYDLARRGAGHLKRYSLGRTLLRTSG